MTAQFTKSFTQQEPLPESAIEQAIALLRNGRLHRYNVLPGEEAAAALLEQEYAQWLGVDYCLACASGGYAMHIALKAAGLETGEPVLTNAFTLAPVPGAIHNAGGHSILVEIDENYCVDLAHLEQQMKQTQSRFFMLSHMRGHLADMEVISALCQHYGVILIEDCAHTMGASWGGKRSGTFGDIACFSTQTYKHMNSGEGGFLTTNNPEIMAKAIVHSGSYMLYQRHGTPPPAEVFERIRLYTPNYSGRMDNLRAALLRAQLPLLADNCARWNKLYQAAEKALNALPLLSLPTRSPQEYYVGSSIQFRIPALTTEQAPDFLADCFKRGVELKWFGSAEPQGFTSRYDSWLYLDDIPTLPRTLSILANTFDMRIPLTFEEDDMPLISEIIGEVAIAHA